MAGCHGFNSAEEIITDMEIVARLRPHHIGYLSVGERFVTHRYEVFKRGFGEIDDIPLPIRAGREHKLFTSFERLVTYRLKAGRPYHLREFRPSVAYAVGNSSHTVRKLYAPDRGHIAEDIVAQRVPAIGEHDLFDAGLTEGLAGDVHIIADIYCGEIPVGREIESAGLECPVSVNPD